MVILPEIGTQRLLEIGMMYLKDHPEELDDIFAMFTTPTFSPLYGGQSYIDDIKKWFLATKIPIVMSWGFNTERVPSISIHLSDEVEDEGNSALGDHFLDDFETGEVDNIAPFSVSLDVGIHAAKDGDYVLWLYYIVQWILFSFKRLAEQMGMQMQTYRVGDFNRNNQYLANNIWSRWIKLKTTTFTTWTEEKMTSNSVEINFYLSKVYDIEAVDETVVLDRAKDLVKIQ